MPVPKEPDDSTPGKNKHALAKKMPYTTGRPVAPSADLSAKKRESIYTRNADKSGDGPRPLAFGSALLLIAVGFAVWGFAQKDLTPDQRNILVWILPLASGASAFCFTGGLSVRGKRFLKGVTISATGGFGVWLLTAFLIFPKPLPSPTQPTQPGLVSIVPVTHWIKTAAEARKADVVRSSRPLPGNVLEARAGFERWWTETPLSARKNLEDAKIFDALSLNIRIYRVQEVEQTQKGSSIKWADEAIGFFEAAGSRHFLAESLMEKAALFLDMSDIRHTKPAAFANLAEQGESTMRRAFELSRGDQKSEALRVWSRFYYNLARPRDGNLTENWDNNFLLVSEARMREAYQLDPAQLKNVSQLARVTQKAAANPPQDSSKDWTQKLWEVQRLLKIRWTEAQGGIQDSRSRVASLHILAVITMDAVLRSWLETSESQKAEQRPELLTELDRTALPIQRDALALVIGSELEEAYDFDIYYDLARIHAVRLLVAETGVKTDPGGDLKAVEKNLASARKGATTTQLEAAVDSISKYPCFAEQNEERRRAFVKILSVGK